MENIIAFVSENWLALSGILGFVIAAFVLIARFTKNTIDDKIAQALEQFAEKFGVNVPDAPGENDEQPKA